MIRITVSPKHPITIVAADERRFHFAQLIAVSKNIMWLQLRKAVPSIASLDVSSVFIETFGQLSEVRFGTVTLEIGCHNISTVRDRLVKLEFADPSAVNIRITQRTTTSSD
jgi:hypothetical protein